MMKNFCLKKVVCAVLAFGSLFSLTGCDLYLTPVDDKMEYNGDVYISEEEPPYRSAYGSEGEYAGSVLGFHLTTSPVEIYSENILIQKWSNEEYFWLKEGYSLPDPSSVTLNKVYRIDYAEEKAEELALFREKVVKRDDFVDKDDCIPWAGERETEKYYCNINELEDMALEIGVCYYNDSAYLEWIERDDVGEWHVVAYYKVKSEYAEIFQAVS